MEKPRWIILCLGIIFFILNRANGLANITSCWVTAGADRESLTINVTYAGDAHKGTHIRFSKILRTITAIEAPCETSSSSSDLTFTSCTNSSSSNEFHMYLYYGLNSLTNTNITLRKFKFPIESQSYPTSIAVWILNSSTWGSGKWCSVFSSLPAFSLLDLDLHMVNTSMTYEKTDIMIEFKTNAAVVASPTSTADYTFKFPPGTLTSLSLCMEQTLAGSSSITGNNLIFVTTTSVNSGEPLNFEFIDIYNPPAPDIVQISINTAHYDEVPWTPTEIGTLHNTEITLSTYGIGQATTFTFSLDLNPFPLQQNDEIKMHFNSEWTYRSLPSCSAPFSQIDYGDDSGWWILCQLTTSEFIIGDITIDDFLSNPPNEGTYYVNVTIYRNYTAQNGTSYTKREVAHIDNMSVDITWIFNPGSRIENNGTREIEKESKYLFNLSSSISSLSSSTTIQIIFKGNYLRPSTSCTSNIGTCSVLGNGITLNNPYPSGYTCCFYTQFVVNGIINPNSSYPYSFIAFDILAIDGGTLVSGNNLPLYIGGTYTQYTPHNFGVASNVLGDSNSTVAITSYTFTLINTDYAIPSECIYMTITLPSGMQFISPSVTIIYGLSTVTVSHTNSTDIVIANAFSGGVPANTNMKFQISNIQNPYARATDLIFVVCISLLKHSYFQSITEFHTDIDTISDFLLFTVSSSSLTVSELSTYTVEFKLREGNLAQNDFVKLKVPNSIKYCDHSTISLTQSCNNNILSSYKYKYSEYRYGYKSHQCTNYNGANIKFTITCRNPETKKPTGNFKLQAQSDKDSSESIYYKSSGSPITMTTQRSLQSFTFNYLHEWINYPNKFTFSIQKTSPNISSDIDIIRIQLYGNFDIVDYPSCPSIGNISGITAEAGGLVIECNVDRIIIKGVSALSQTFAFSLDKIKNPDDKNHYIKFRASTRNNEPLYYGEYRNSSEFSPLCEYPCKTCVNWNSSKCTTCYSEDNIVFEGGTSKHLHYHLGTNQTCLNSCPTHTYLSSSTCANCDSNCKECQGTSTTCTECYVDAFLLNAVCEYPHCPTGYSDNVDDWSCVLIRGYESGTQITILDDIEVEKIARYKFILKPEVGLNWTDSKLQITSPSSIGANTPCYSTLSSCSISGSIITISNLLTVDYTAGVTSPIEIEIYDTYTNPPVTYLYTETKFLVQAMINATVYHSGEIAVSGSGGTDTRYTPHAMGFGPILITNSSTVSFNTLTFNLTNTDYPIPIGYKIILTFPPDLIFTSTDQPIYTPVENLDAGSSLTVFTSTSVMQITGGFTGTALLANENIRFSVNNILNPYKLGVTATILVDIAAGNGTELEKQFALNNGLTMNIINIAEFSIFNVNTTSNTTSATTYYNFQLTLGDGGLTTAHKIVLQVPDTVKNCDANTLQGTQGISSVLINKAYDSSENKYYFDLPCTIAGGTLTKFRMTCQNPETTKTTGNFIVHSAIISSPTDIFYSSTGSSLSMNTLNNFQGITISKGNPDNPPLLADIFTINVQRTATYPSTHINQLQITVPDTMNISAVTYSLISGITSVDPSLSIMGQIIVIDGITQLLQNFSFNLIDILDPPLSTDLIRFGILTKHTDGSEGEEANTTNTLHILCDFPCETCRSGQPNKCITCTSIFEGYFLFQDEHCAKCPKHTYFDHTLKDCLPCDKRCDTCTGSSNKDCTNCALSSLVILKATGDCECQIGYFPRADGACTKCDITCEECRGLTANDCLKCKFDIVIYDPINYMCICPSNYYPTHDGNCLPCDSCCKKCTGPGNHLCVENECDKANSCYPLAGQPRTCIRDCNSLTPLYLDTSTPNSEVCRECHSNCLMCYGSENNTCLECAPPKLLTQEKECLYDNCPPLMNTFTTETKCEKCSDRCRGCALSPFNCLSCEPPYYFFAQTNSCITACPDQFYANIQSSQCQNCPNKCFHCDVRNSTEGVLECSLCMFNYFLDSKGVCVTGSNCGENYYPALESRTCEPCNEACDGCLGSQASDCIICAEKYLLSSKQICEEVICQSDEYLQDETFVCKKCNKRCLGCKGPSEFECKGCASGYLMNTTIFQCQTCEQYNIAYLSPLPGKIGCLEICGDKKNMGILECDDGNIISGDGCSFDCKIEENFICSGGGLTTPDICVETVQPSMNSFFQINKEQIQVEFTEFVKFKAVNPMTALQLYITGPAIKYEFEVEDMNLTAETNPLLVLKLNITFLCTLYGTEKMIISINDTNMISDIAGNVILNTSIPIKLQPFEFISDDQKEVAEGTGSGSQQVLISTLITALLMCLVFNTPLEGLWGLINVLQLISYTMLLPLQFPKNLLIFLDAIAMVHGFNKFIPNLFAFLIFDEDYHDQAYNDTFKNRGFDTRTMLLLVGSELTLFLFIFIAIGLLLIIKKFCKKLRNVIDKILKKLRYSILIRSLITGYLKIVLASFINFAIISYHNYESVYSSFFCTLVTAFVVLFPAYLSEFMYRNFKNAQNSEKFIERYDSLIKEFAIAKVFLFRRSIFGAILVFLYDSPIAQLVIIELTTVFMLIWMISTFPFKDRLICCSHIISELGFLLYVSALFFFLSQTMETNSRSYLGSIIIWGLIGLIVVIWIIFIIHIVKTCLEKRQIKKDEKLAKELESAQNEKDKKDRVDKENAIVCKKRHRKLVKMISNSKTKKRRRSIMDQPICTDTLGSQPRPRLISKKSANRFIIPGKSTTKEQDKEILLRKIQLKPNEKITAAKYNDTSKLMREFNEKWRKRKNPNQTLKEALFDVYVERNRKPKYDQEEDI